VGRTSSHHKGTETPRGLVLVLIIVLVLSAGPARRQAISAKPAAAGGRNQRTPRKSPHKAHEAQGFLCILGLLWPNKETTAARKIAVSFCGRKEAQREPLSPAESCSRLWAQARLSCSPRVLVPFCGEKRTSENLISLGRKKAQEAQGLWCVLSLLRPKQDPGGPRPRESRAARPPGRRVRFRHACRTSQARRRWNTVVRLATGTRVAFLPSTRTRNRRPAGQGGAISSTTRRRRVRQSVTEIRNRGFTRGISQMTDVTPQSWQPVGFLVGANSDR